MDNETNKKIHSLLNGCWHDRPGVCPNYDAHTRANMPDKFKSISEYCGHPNYLRENLPHSTLVEIVTAAIEKYGILKVGGVLATVVGETEDNYPCTAEYFRLPAPQIVTAVAEMEGK